LELRRLQTITEVGAEQNSTIVIALPEFLGQAGQMLATMKGG
jgi:hypothetical protein